MKMRIYQDWWANWLGNLWLKLSYLMDQKHGFQCRVSPKPIHIYIIYIYILFTHTHIRWTYLDILYVYRIHYVTISYNPNIMCIYIYIHKYYISISISIYIYIHIHICIYIYIYQPRFACPRWAPLEQSRPWWMRRTSSRLGGRYGGTPKAMLSWKNPWTCLEMDASNGVSSISRWFFFWIYFYTSETSKWRIFHGIHMNRYGIFLERWRSI